ncbi:MAG: ABC transporter permease [Gemmatimonadaceae bacterium]|nr:ABC transporter permease [Gemmatimonadaceae bacterium]
MIREAFALAFRAVRRNVMRSTLTVLGIVIGVAAVIAMVTLGKGTTARVTESIQSLGSNVLIVTPGAQAGRGPGGAAVAGPAFTLRDVAAILQDISGITAVAPMASARGQVVAGDANWPTTIIGTTNDYFVVRDWRMSTGREFTDAEMRSGRPVCIVGSTVSREIFQAQDPVGASIRVHNVPCEIIGVLVSKGQAMGGNDQDDIVILPMRAVQRRINGSEDVTVIQMSVQSSAITGRVAADLAALLRERRHIVGGKEDDFRVLNIAEIANTVQSTTNVLTEFLSALAAVSLLVGGIGIMNIMLVSVTERTREIGIRLAVGALERDILAQFLVEAVVLSLCGGLIGIALGLAGSYFAVPMIKVPFIFDPTVVVLSFGFSGAVGVIFGFFPARKAAQLNPIEALRHE